MDESASSYGGTVGERQVYAGSAITQSLAKIADHSDWSMLLRVGVLGLMAILAALVPDLDSTPSDQASSRWSYWAWLAIGYGLSVLAAWWWDKKSNPAHAGWIQLSVDTVLAAVVVQLSGGLASNFTLLYLVAIAASASRGSPSQVWGSFGASAITYSTLSCLELLDWVEVENTSQAPILLKSELWTIARNLGAMLAICLFAVRLTRMWQEAQRARLLAETRQAQGHSQIIELQQHLEQSERMAAIGQLAATVAHEIRNPLAAMSGCVQVLALPLDPQEKTRLLEIIDREIRRLDNTVQQLLDYARPSTHQKSEGDLVGVVKEVIDAFSLDPQRKGLQLNYEGPNQALGCFERESIAQLLWNLLHNAAHAQQNRGCIVIRVDQDEHELCLEVIDEGCGIDPEESMKVFEPYYTTKSEGSGFGLAVVAKIVQRHGGNIEIVPQTKGSCFSIRWPKIPDTALLPQALAA